MELAKHRRRYDVYGIRCRETGRYDFGWCHYSEWLPKTKAVKDARILKREYPGTLFEVYERESFPDRIVWTSKRKGVRTEEKAA